MATYAAQIDSLDQNVGRVMQALRRAGVDKNTLVFFLSDNGSSDSERSASLDKPGATWREDGTPTKVGNTPDVQPGPANYFVMAGPAWANVANTPFRQHKQSNHEGGIASPLIVSWPGVVVKPGTVSPQMAHIADILATCLDVAGVQYPKRFGERNVLPLAGRSLLPVLKGSQAETHESLCWATTGNRAVRVGKWKLVSNQDRPWELYDLETDRTELNDLAARQPERVQSMAAIFEDWRR